MTAQFKCDVCEEVTPVPVYGATGAEVTNDAKPPGGFGTLFIVEETSDGEGGIETNTTVAFHVCAKCGEHIDVYDELVRFLIAKCREIVKQAKKPPKK